MAPGLVGCEEPVQVERKEDYASARCQKIETRRYPELRWRHDAMLSAVRAGVQGNTGLPVDLISFAVVDFRLQRYP